MCIIQMFVVVVIIFIPSIHYGAAHTSYVAIAEYVCKQKLLFLLIFFIYLEFSCCKFFIYQNFRIGSHYTVLHSTTRALIII